MGRLKVLNSGRFGSAVKSRAAPIAGYGRAYAAWRRVVERRLLAWHGVRVVEGHAVVRAD